MPMNPLGYCLSLFIPLCAGCGYGIYALTRGGQTVSNINTDSAGSAQSQVAEEITQSRESTEALSSSSSDTVNAAGQGEQNTVQRHEPEALKTSPSAPKLKWVLGGNVDGKGELIVQFKEDIANKKGEQIKFEAGFTVSASGKELSAGYILCTINSENNRYFVIKQDGLTKKYTTMDGVSIQPCSWINSPKGDIAKYSLSSWDETGRQSAPLKDTKQIDLSTCTIEINDKNIEAKKLKMQCKESSNLMLGGRPSADIYIELKGFPV